MLTTSYRNVSLSILLGLMASPVMAHSDGHSQPVIASFFHTLMNADHRLEVLGGGLLMMLVVSGCRRYLKVAGQKHSRLSVELSDH